MILLTVITKEPTNIGYYHNILCIHILSWPHAALYCLNNEDSIRNHVSINADSQDNTAH